MLTQRLMANTVLAVLVFAGTGLAEEPLKSGPPVGGA